MLAIDLPWLDEVVRAKRPGRLPVVLTREEVRTVLQSLTGVPGLMALLLYGAGLRLLECCRLRVKDVDFARNQIIVRDGKGHRVRFTGGDLGALSTAARDLVQQGANILFPCGGDALTAAHAATTSIPIVFAGAGDDPVRRGLVKSFALPGGSITGVVDLGIELAGKRLELFREMIPGLQRVLTPYSATDRYTLLEAEAYRNAARRLGIVLVERPVASQKEAQAALVSVRKPDVQGIIAPHSLAWNLPGFALEVAAKHRIPTMFPASFFVEQGGLASYGPDYYATGRQAARLVDKIIKGVKPGEIPVESNPRIEFAINLKVARQLGLAIPPAVQARADRVFE